MSKPLCICVWEDVCPCRISGGQKRAPDPPEAGGTEYHELPPELGANCRVSAKAASTLNQLLSSLQPLGYFWGISDGNQYYILFCTQFYVVNLEVLGLGPDQL